jgi:hypothetical protein
MTTGQTNKLNGQQKSYLPQSFFGGGIKILSKINFKFKKKKILNLVKRPWTNGHILYTPLPLDSGGRGGYKSMCCIKFYLYRNFFLEGRGIWVSAVVH